MAGTMPKATDTRHAMGERDGRITIFGASGYTGRIMLAEARRLGLPMRLAGRREARMREAAVAVGMDAPIVVADVDDQASLDRMTDGCSVLVNCCGPFTELGEPVLASAMQAGAHYIDITGDQGFTRRMYERFDGVARRRGVALVCALGFESTLGDMGAALLAGMPGAPPRFDAVVVLRRFTRD